MTDVLSRIIDDVRAKTPPRGMTTRIIAIDGPGGSGKTTLADRLSRELAGAPILHTDDFASWENPINWWPRVIAEALEPLARNELARFRRSEWEQKQQEQWSEVAPSEFVILEGVTASRDAFRPFLTYSIWIETPRDLRLRRGIERDGEELRAQWEEWMAEEDQYVARAKPHENVDLVLRGDKDLWT